MGLNTYPSNPFPPSTDRIDADALETEVSKLNNDVDELKSGLTNYEATTNAALSVPEDSGKNLFSGSFTTTTNGGVTFTANSDGTVSATNTSTGYASVNSTEFTLKKGQYIFSGAPSGNAKYVLALYANNVVLSQIANGSNVIINIDSDTALVMRCVINGADVETGVDFEPMIRPSFITDPTFAPYIPSVESRIEAVESLIVKTSETVQTNANGTGRLSITFDQARLVYVAAVTISATIAIPFLTGDNTWAVKVMEADDLTPVQDGVLIAYGYIVNS